jgi:type IV secretion system protein VirB8
MGNIFSFIKNNKNLVNDAKNSGNKAKSTIINLFDKNKFINVNDNSRVETKITQIVLFAFFMSLLFNFMLVVVILIMLPLKEKVPYFVHFMPKDEQIVYVEQYKQNKQSLRAVKEFLARDYVKKRETIDLASENTRWNLVLFLSNNEMKNIFINLYEKSNESPYKWAVDNNIIRTINIISSSVLSDDIYQVEYEAIDTFKATGKIMATTIAIATVKFENNTEQLKGQDYLNNPFGYLVADYSIGIKQKRLENKDTNLILDKYKAKENKKDNELENNNKRGDWSEDNN